MFFRKPATDQKDAGPNSLETPKADTRKNGTGYIGLIAVVVLVMAGILYYSLTAGGRTQTKEAEPPALETENRPLMPPTEGGQGLAFTPEPESPASGEEALPAGELRFNVVNPDAADREAEALRQEREEMRRLKAQNGQAALGAPLLILRKAAAVNGGAATPAAGQTASENIGAFGNDYNPTAVTDKETFFERADSTQKDGWLSPYTREQGRPFELKTGAVIPGIMITGINSDLPGSLIAQVSQNVYDSATGRQLLIPQGAKLYGVYDARVAYGQERVLIAWNRIIFPDGSALSLGAMPGTDMAGYAGFNDQVDNHYFRIFGSAFLMSLVSGGMSYAVDQVSNNDNRANSTTVQDEMSAALAAQMGQAALTLLEKNLSVSPTLKIRPGYRFNIVIIKDLVFAGAYAGR